MLRLTLGFLLLAFCRAEILDVELYFKTSVPAVSEKVARVVKRVNADNRFVSANFDQIDCKEVDISDNDDIIRKLCDEVEDSVALVIYDRTEPNKKTWKLIPESNFKDASQLATELFVDLASSTYRRRANAKAEDFWATVSDPMKTKIQENYIKSSDELTKFTESDSNDKVFVLFYKPEGFSNFAAVFYLMQAAEVTAAKFSLIDCSTISDVCEDIEETPVLYSYLNGQKYTQFEKEWFTENIRDWMKILRKPVITSLTEDVVPQYRSGIVPDFDEIQSTVTMFFVPNKKSPVYKYYKQFARERHGNYHLTALVDQGIEKWANQPAFITMKPKEKLSLAFVLYQDLSYEKMVNFIENGVYPSVHELTDASSSLEALSLPRPLLIFFDPEAVKNSTEFLKLAADHPVRSTISAFASIRGLSLFGLFLQDLLGDDLRPSYILIDTEKKCLTRKLISAETKEEILHWLKSATHDCETEFELNRKVLEDLYGWEQRERLHKKMADKKEKNGHEEL